MAIIDSQVHVYEANAPKRPWHSVPNWPDHVTGDEMVAAMDKVSVDGAIFISAFSMSCAPVDDQGLSCRKRACTGFTFAPPTSWSCISPVSGPSASPVCSPPARPWPDTQRSTTSKRIRTRTFRSARCSGGASAPRCRWSRNTWNRSRSIRTLPRATSRSSEAERYTWSTRSLGPDECTL